jgi:hypothetical protein
MTAKMPTVLWRLGQRAYGGDSADGSAVRGACARTAARRRGLDAPRGGDTLGCGRPRAWQALGGARPREARATSRRAALWPKLLCWCCL